MKPNQEYIYYIGGESKEMLMKHPNIQALVKKGYEVLLLDDPIDEFAIQNIYDYEKKMLVNTGKGRFIMPKDSEDEELKKKKMKIITKLYEPLTEWWKNILKDKLDQVLISERIVEDPCVVVGSVYGLSASMERITKSQTYGPQNP
jgi:heat shock protein beta